MIILASGSPRRKEFLRQMLGSEDRFLVDPADIPEPLPEEVAPEENAKRLALEKAKAVFIRHPADLVIASDTVVGIDGHQLAKPFDVVDAERMLRSLLGRESTVSTSLAFVSLGKEIVEVETTRVVFRSADEPGVEEALQTYLASGDWADKAGAYGIQSGAHALIRGIRGHVSVVIGLPVERLRALLENEFFLKTHHVDVPLPDGIVEL